MALPRTALSCAAVLTLIVSATANPTLVAQPAEHPEHTATDHVSAGPSSLLASCRAPGDTLRLPLPEFWTRAQAADPFLRQFRELAQAEEETRSAIRREWMPTGAVQGAGDYGQRLSPGEERVLGVGARGELRLLSQWRLLDGDRSARAATAGRRRLAVRAEEDVFRADLQADLARLYLEGVAARERISLRQRHLDRLEELGGLVQERALAGFESRWEEGLLAESLLRAGRLLQEARAEQDAAHWEMALRLDGCPARIPDGVRIPSEDPGSGHPTGATLPRDGAPLPDMLPGIRRAETLESLAREEASRDRWSLELLGVVGPTRSRAFTDTEVRSEYLVGVALSWRPDLAGIRGRLAEAERARARAELAWADGVRGEVERELVQLEIELERLRETGLLLDREVEAAEGRVAGAAERWAEGVDRWLDVVQAAERLTELEVEALAHRVQVVQVVIRRHRLLGSLDLIPDLLFAHPAPASPDSPPPPDSPASPDAPPPPDPPAPSGPGALPPFAPGDTASPPEDG